MNIYLHIAIVAVFALIGCNSATTYNQQNNIDFPRIGISGIDIACNKFSSVVPNEDAFHSKTYEDVFSGYLFFAEESPLRKRVNWFSTLKGYALLVGILTLEAYESILGKTQVLLKKNMTNDGLFSRYSRNNEFVWYQWLRR